MQILERYSPSAMTEYGLRQRNDAASSGWHYFLPPSEFEYAEISSTTSKSRGVEIFGSDVVNYGDDIGAPNAMMPKFYMEQHRFFDKKYGAMFRGTEGGYIYDFQHYQRRAGHIYGAGIILGGDESHQPRNTGSLEIDGFVIDCATNASPTYDHFPVLGDPATAKYEAVGIEAGNPVSRFRRGVMGNGGDSAIDSKSSVELDGVTIYGGLHTIRMHLEGSVQASHSLFLIHPGQLLLSKGIGPVRFEYFNCKFGIIGESWDQLRDHPPAEWFASDNLELPTVVALDSEPYDRAAGSFYEGVPVRMFVPSNLLVGAPYNQDVQWDFAAAAAPEPTVETAPEATAPEAPAPEAPVEEVATPPVEEVIAPEAPVEEAPAPPAEEAPVEEPAPEAPVEEAVAVEPPVEEAVAPPAEEAPVETAAPEAPVEPTVEAVTPEAPAEEAPAPAEEAPAPEAPIEAAVEEPAAPEATPPAEEAPAPKAPTVEEVAAPVEEAPAPEAPVEAAVEEPPAPEATPAPEVVEAAPVVEEAPAPEAPVVAEEAPQAPEAPVEAPAPVEASAEEAAPAPEAPVPEVAVEEPTPAPEPTPAADPQLLKEAAIGRAYLAYQSAARLLAEACEHN